MTLKQFERYLKKASPKLRVRQRGYKDVGGIFVGLSGKSGYIARITKGEMTLMGYREMLPDPENALSYVQGNIKKRGRKTLISLLRSWRWLPKHKDRSRALWGIKNI